MKSIKHPIRAWFAAAIAAFLISHVQAASPVAHAGPDHTVADYDGNNSVTLRLNASGSTDPDNDIVSYAWSWPGGSASGLLAEGVFPATNAPVTVTLTVTDAQANVSTDTLVVTAYQPDVALFKDLGDRVPFSYTDATIAGETVVLGAANRLQGVFRRSGGVWSQTPATGIDFNHFAVDANTIFGGNFYGGTNLGVLRYNGSEWVQSPLTLSAPLMPQNEFFFPYNFAADPQTVVVADPNNGTNGSQTGRVFVYDWVGDNLNFSAELTLPGGLTAGDQFGFKIAVQGDLLVVASKLVSTFGDELHVYRKIAGNWVFEETLTGSGGYFIAYNISIGNGSILMARYNPSFQMVVLEKTGPSWVQTPINGNPFGFPISLTYAMNHDGLAFAVGDNNGSFHLFKKGTESPTWAGSTVITSRLLTRDLPATQDTRVTAFSNGLVAISNQILGFARIIDTNTRIDPINVEPVANAGSDITTTSFDGNPVRVFLNGGASRDLNYNSTMSAVWSWAGGSTTGLQVFANIPTSVTSIELRITDNQGAISRDTVNIDIDRPPVINAGPDVTVVDVDGDGNVRLNVHGTLVSSSNPIISWSWRWPGDTLSGQSGTITLGPLANGKSVVLQVVDSKGLAAEDEFVFRISSQNPQASILQAVDGATQDRFGTRVSIDEDIALITAPGRNAAYLSENINGDWQQIALSPETPQGSSVLVDGDTAFVGATSLEVGGIQEVGGVFIYKRESGIWTQSGLITPPGPITFNEFSNALFGSSIAKSGNWLLVSMPGLNNPPNVRDGAVFLFENVSDTWIFRQKLTSPDAENFSGFGKAIAISGDSLVITSELYQGGYDKGVAHIFTRGATQWQFAIRAESDVPDNLTFFGGSVAMNDTEILIGASREANQVDPNGQGVVYRYTKTAGTWTRNGKLLPTVFTPTALQSFGASLFLRNDILLVGAPGDYGFSPVSRTGRVHVLKFTAGNWTFVDDIFITTQDDPQINFFNSGFGNSLSHDGKDLIVGAPGANTAAGLNGGKAYIFRDYAALAPGGNFEPLANAGADINVIDTLVRGPAPDYLITEPLGSELVTLDASASTDQENAIVSYLWTWTGGSATGVSPSARFPVGTTAVTLTVADENGIVNSDTVTITVFLSQTAPAALPVVSGNTLTVGLPSPLAKWRLSSEFLWHGDNESTNGVEVGATYQVEILPYPGSTEVISTFITIDGPAMTVDLELELPTQPATTGSISFPETSQGFSWRLVGESAWRNVTDDNDELIESVEFLVPIGAQRLEFKPVAGFTTPQNRLVVVGENTLTGLDWADYLRISSFNPAKTFELAAAPDLSASPYQYVGMIRSALGRGTGTVVAERTVLTAAHLFFDSNGLQWADTQWHSRQQQGTRQAPPVAPRGVLYQTSYAKLVAPDSVEGTVTDLPEDPQEVDFAVLFFADQATWDLGSANFLQSTPAKNWLTGAENKHAVAYPQRSQEYENRGKIFQKQFATPLQSLGTGLYETTEVFGDGGASGSALFVQPAGGTNFYPAAILLAGQGRAVYRVIDEGITRMIKDGEDAATGNDDVLNNDSSLVVFNGLGSLTTIGVQVAPDWLAGSARWSIYPANAAAVTNMPISQSVAFNTKWSGYTIVFSAISGYYTPAAFYAANASVTRGAANIRAVTYVPIPPPPPPPTPLETWVALYSISDMASDDDKDGMSALLEYALDRDPGQPDYRSAILLGDNPSQSLYAEFDVYVSSAAAGINYQVKASDSLDRNNAVTLATFTSVDGSSTYRKVTDTQLRSASQTRFAWVEIELP